MFVWQRCHSMIKQSMGSENPCPQILNNRCPKLHDATVAIIAWAMISFQRSPNADHVSLPCPCRARTRHPFLLANWNSGSFGFPEHTSTSATSVRSGAVVGAQAACSFGLLISNSRARLWYPPRDDNRQPHLANVERNHPPQNTFCYCLIENHPPSSNPPHDTEVACGDVHKTYGSKFEQRGDSFSCRVRIGRTGF